MSFVCNECGETHDGLPTDSAFKLPDDVWAIPEPERSAKAKFTSDLCQLAERYFIRCLLEVPFTDQSGYYGWGAWAEVDWPVFKRYLDLYEKDGTAEAQAEGKLANDLPTYSGTLGLRVLLKFQTPDRRPTLHFPANARHQLAREAAQGISYTRFHEILVARKQVS